MAQKAIFFASKHGKKAGLSFAFCVFVIRSRHAGPDPASRDETPN